MPVALIFFNPTLSLSNRTGRLTSIPKAISAKESVVNLATPHSDEAKAIIDNCIKIANEIQKNNIRLFFINSLAY